MTSLETIKKDAKNFSAELSGALEDFQHRYPAYATTSRLDDLRASEYVRLERPGQVYLDYAGGSLYAESQLRMHVSMLADGVFGNPHSKSLTSAAATRLVEQTRQSVLKYFNASPDEYSVIFTPNATGALKLVGEAYPFRSGDNFLLTFDNHNSVNGIREFAKARGARVTYIPVRPPELRVYGQDLEKGLSLAKPGKNNLLAYPAQSNFSGAQHPLEWIELTQSRGWDVLLDASAFVPTNRLDLGRWHPNFVALSFYKIFGYPTGIGCLIVRNSALAKLKRPWYSGGTSTFSTVQGQNHYLTPGPAGFEDGTVNYLNLPAVEYGLKHMEAIGLDLIHSRVMSLTAYLIDQLTAMRHRNGLPLVRLYGPANRFWRGGIVTVNFFDRNGKLLDCTEIEKLANYRRISLRAGCHCNPGAREVALAISQDDLSKAFARKDKQSYEQFLQALDGKTTGALRISLGLVSNFSDVYKFLNFCEIFLNSDFPD